MMSSFIGKQIERGCNKSEEKEPKIFNIHEDDHWDDVH